MQSYQTLKQGRVHKSHSYHSALKDKNKKNAYVYNVHYWSRTAAAQTNGEEGATNVYKLKLYSELAHCIGGHVVRIPQTFAHSVIPPLRRPCPLRETSTAAQTTRQQQRHHRTQLHLETQSPYCKTCSIGRSQFYTLFFIRFGNIESETNIHIIFWL